MRYKITRKHSLFILTAVSFIFLITALVRQFNSIAWKMQSENEALNDRQNNKDNFNLTADKLILKTINRENYHSQINHNDYTIPIVNNAQSALEKIEVNTVSSYQSIDINTANINTKGKVNLD